jgi:myosin light chain 6
MLQSKQVGEVLRALNTNPTEADIRKLVQSQKNDDRISFEEFLPIFQAVSAKKITDTADDFVEGLRHFDKVIFLGLK